MEAMQRCLKMILAEVRYSTPVRHAGWNAAISNRCKQFLLPSLAQNRSDGKQVLIEIDKGAGDPYTMGPPYSQYERRT